ncbi:MAG: DUF11 domain-containing protein [Pedosphaera sp.]|nr:DUF11 domain-containing protein [Pedosphaera sp.]
MAGSTVKNRRRARNPAGQSHEVMKLKKFLAAWAVLLSLSAGRLLGGPAISSFTPVFGSASDPGFITIHGSGFYPGTLVVKFNGVTDPTAGATLANGTEIQAHVPAGAPTGVGPIFVSVDGIPAYSGQDFTVIGPGPYITGFTPATGGAGAPVTINGAHFSNPLTVTFNGVNVPGASAASPTQISVTAPAGVTTGPISVTTTLGSYTTVTNFFVPPVVTGFSPAAGRSGTNVTITGANFLGATAVRFFNNQDATSFSVLSNGAVSAMVPAGATTGLIRVITPAGSAFSSGNFVVQPTVTGFTPGFGPVGTSVTVSGANFIGTPTVKFGNIAAATPTGITSGQLTAVVPAGATNGPISVTTTDGTATSATNFFLPPGITSFTPTNSAPGTLVVISGVNFLNASAVSFNGTPAAAFYISNNISLGAVVPAGVTSGPISLTAPAGTANSAANFYGAPSISSFNPTHGLPGTNVTISGLNFLGASAVRFNGTNAASFTVTNNTTIGAVVQAGASTGPITVVAPAGTTNSASNFVLDYAANLSVTVSDSPDPVLVGSNLVYTITIANSGPFAAPGVTLTDTLIGPALLVAATTSQGTLITNTSPITGSLGQINSGANAIVTLTVVPQDVGTITNIATVASLYTDPAPANNSTTNTTLVQPLPILSVKRSGATGVRISWSAALTNYGLEFNSNFLSATLWSNVVALPVIVGSEYQLTETNNRPMRYYRLHRLP